MMRENKLPNKTKQPGPKNLVSDCCGPCEDKEGKNQRLEVTVIVPEENLGQVDNTATSKDLITLPALPSICEFAMFSSNRTAMKPDQQVSHVRPLTKLPPMYANNSRVNGAAGGLATDNRSEMHNKGPITCAKQNIRMEIQSKLPEDYREPTYKETKKRIWDWLKQSEEHKPTYLRRANALTKRVSLDITDTQYQTFSQQKSLTQRIGL